MHLIFERFSPPKCTKNDPQMGGKKLGKFHFGRLGRPRGAPRTPKATHWTPRTPKMEPKAPPEPPKWTPRDPQSSQKGAQATPKRPKWDPSCPQESKTAPKFPNYSKEALTNERTHTHTHKHTRTYTHTHTRTHTNRRKRLTTQQLTNPTNNPDSAAERNARSD